MERLNFGIKARRRVRRQRMLRRAAMVSLAAMVIGVPGATAGLDLVRALIGPEPARARGGVETSESAAGILRFRNRVVEARAPAPPVAESQDQQDGDEVEAVATAPGSSIETVISQAAAEFGLDSSYLLSVADCESDLDPYAVNPVGYYGLFQFDESTWASYGYGSIYDPTAQARTAARLIAAGQTTRWPNCA